MPNVCICTTKEADLYQTSVDLLKKNGFTVSFVGDPEFGMGLKISDNTIRLLQKAHATMAAGEYYTSELFKQLPNLRVISRLGVGFDRVDIQSATQNNVVVTITPNGNHEGVAEHAMALIMTVAKQIVSKDKKIRSGVWDIDRTSSLRADTLGIIGLGRIGRSLALRALAMKMKVIATEPYPNEEFVKSNCLELVDIDTLLKRSDYVSVNSPFNEMTKGLIDKEKLSLMKKTAYLINTSRGGLINESDLISALKNNDIAGAGLDVFEIEPITKDNPLIELNNVVLSPHMAGNDAVSIEDTAIEAAQYIIDLYHGFWPRGAVINNELEDQWSW
jgi:phosphoglycerate dehydrogenase-like enzyme